MKRPWVVVGGILALLLVIAVVGGAAIGVMSLLGLFAWGLDTTPLPGTVVAKPWTCRVVTREWQPVVAQWWGDELTERAGTPPGEGRRELGSVRNIRDCRTRRDIVRCEGTDCYRHIDRPWCRFDTEEWIDTPLQRFEGDGDTPPRCPTVEASDTSRHTTERTFEVHVEYRPPDADPVLHVHTAETRADYDRWSVGEPVGILRNNFGVVTDVLPLEAP